ncbi:chymotrypsin inhibitor-like [Ceratina calcarata]|uniref:Chymotrypsin inhibitor-like n=1 Tax=Ceratina calcarata TaxID=156304 RepID=A0AAJ7JCC7_9HYME|nr:chymotrypsin inhibitor-like [Ceratina calcarata]
MSRSAVVLALLALVCVCMSAVSAVKICPPNEVFKECGTRCEPTCKVPKPPVNCIQECVMDTCQCIPGFVRNSENQCVEPNQC